MRLLRPIRIALALLLLAPVAAAFLAPGGLVPAAAARALVRLQLVPALLAFTAGAGWVMLLGPVAIALLTVVAGRITCSTLCPLGTFQDAVIRLSARLRRRPRNRSAASRGALHLALGGAALALGLAGHPLLLGLLEPYAAFGRGVSLLGRPVVAAVLGAAAQALARLDVYALTARAAPPAGWAEIAFAAGWLAAVSLLAWSRGRLFCNLLCPAGALLRVLARAPLLRLAIDRDRCNGCGACERACKARCVDADRQRMESADCVRCFRCASVCRTGAIHFEGPGARTREPSAVDGGRRRLLATAGAAVGVMTVGTGVAWVSEANRGPGARGALPIVPPGAGSLARFASLCTGCQLCAGRCPSRVLRPSLSTAGAGGVLLPHLVFASGGCDLECTVCGQVCPTGAIAPLSLEAKRLVQIGRARLVEDRCVAITRHRACGACAEHCPTLAVRMVPGADGVPVPALDGALCIGCGACEYPCPSTPEKAIFVEALARHGQARRAERSGPVTPAPEDAEFPF